MARPTIGIRLESLNLPMRRALEEVARLEVRGVQVDATADLAPARLTQTAQRGFLHLLRSRDMELTALGCPLRRGLDVHEGQEALIDHVRRVMTLSYELGPRKVVVSVGRVPEDPADPSASTLTEALLALGHHGDRVGATLALETGLESGATLARYLRTFDTGGLAVNFDPANLIMGQFDPYESVLALGDLVIHTHAREARAASTNRAAQEVLLGNGDLDWYRYLGALEEIGYHGWLTVDPQGGNDRLRDVTHGVAFLRRLVG